MFVVFSGLDISFTVSVILISMIIVAYIFSMKRKKERSKSQDEMGQRKTTKLRNGLRLSALLRACLLGN